jgi:O-antigen ligase
MARALADSSGWGEERMEQGSVLRAGAVVGSYLGILQRQRWVIGLGVSSVCLAWVIAYGGGLGIALALALLPVAAVVLAPSKNRLMVGTAMVLLLPWWYTFGPSQLKVFVVASLLAMTGLIGAVANQSRQRQPVNIIDLALTAFITAAVLSVAFVGPYTYNSVTAVALALLPLGFYAAGRNLGSSMWRPIFWVGHVGGTIASLPLFYEFFVLHRPLFGNGSAYQWSGEAGSLFRPGGTFGSPPAAVTALSMTALCGLSLLVTSAGARRLIVWVCLTVSIFGMIVTFTRAGIIGFAVGLVVFVALWRPASLGRFTFGTAALSLIFLLAVLPHLASKGWYEEGVTRRGNLAIRELRWKLAWPIITNSTTHLTLGHGFNSLQIGHPGGLSGEPDADLAAQPALIKESPHSQYIRTLLEQGFVGVALLLAWLLGSVGKAVGAVRGGRVGVEGRALLASCTAAIVSFMIVSLAGDGFRDPSSLAILALVTGLVAGRSHTVARAAA